MIVTLFLLMVTLTLGWHHKIYEKLQAKTSDIPFAKNKMLNVRIEIWKKILQLNERMFLYLKKPYLESKYIEHVLRLDFVNIFVPSLTVL